MIRIEVAYALPNKQKILTCSVAEGTTVADAVGQSGLENFFPDIDLAGAALGIFGKAVPDPQNTMVKEGDRIEVYRPLLVDPKEVRKQRAAKTKAGKGASD